MKLNYWLVLAAIAITLFLSSPGITQITADKPLVSSEELDIKKYVAQNTSSSAEGSDILYFGYGEDTSPISYKYNGEFLGYCRQLVDYLKNNSFTIKEIPLTLDERFKGKVKPDNSKEFVHLAGECGANTITQEREDKIRKIGGEFSKPFLTTGVKLLLKNKKLESFYEEIPLKDEKIGVVRNTTRVFLIPNLYPSSETKPFKNRTEVIEDLKNDKIVAFAASEITLKDILKEKILDKKEYSIVPKIETLSYEEFGIIVYNNKRLLDLINDRWLNSQEGEAAKSDLEKYLEKNWLDKILKSWYQDNLISFWLLISLLIILSLFIIRPFLLFLLVKIIPSKLAKFFYKKPDNNIGGRVITIMFYPAFYTTVNWTRLELINRIASDTINQIPGEREGIKKELEELQKIVSEETKLDPWDKAKALEQVIYIAQAEQKQNPTDETKQTAKKAIKVLEGITTGLSGVNSCINECNELSSNITKLINKLRGLE
jgi:hypothetical protein